MSDLERPFNGQGEIERFGASIKIHDALIANFADRGRKAASLLVATLTETPYSPTIDGQEFGLEVSNIYRGIGDEDGGEAPDTVDEAVAALREFTGARVPGTRRVYLQNFSTGYRKMLRKLSPGITTPELLHDAFYDEFVSKSNERGVAIQGPEQGIAIIKRAPSDLRALRLGHQAVTEDGHMLSLSSDRGYWTERRYYFLSTDIDDLRTRGGQAPIPGIVREISNEVIRRRTRHSSR